MESKQTILQALRFKRLDEQPAPSLQQNWVATPNAIATFEKMVAAVGGNCIRVRNMQDGLAKLPELPCYADAKKVCSLVEGVEKANVFLDDIADPHDLEDVDVAIVRGEFGVAENGAVWLTDRGVKHRVIYFIPQHIIVLLDADQIVHNMHQAYERVGFEQAGFGVFLSGPSKTADIEQSLVIGAHGARSLHVLLLENGGA